VFKSVLEMVRTYRPVDHGVFQDHEFAPSDPTDVPIDNCGCTVTTAVTSEPTDVPETTTITSEPTAVTKSKSKKRK